MAGRCVRVAVVTIMGARPDLARDLDAANRVYLGECGVSIDIVASITEDRPDLLILDQTDCLGEDHEVSDEEDELFDLGRDLGADIVCYYIQGDTSGGYRGCAAHPPNRRGFWVADNATEWTFVHELTHVVGDNEHVSDKDNLMYSPTSGITNPPPDLNSGQCSRINNDGAMIGCVSAVEGQLSFLRVHDVGTRFGPPGDQLDAEVIVRIETEPNMAFGFQLRQDENEAARDGMLEVLRRAFIHDRPVRLDYTQIGLNRTSGIILRVAEIL